MVMKSIARIAACLVASGCFALIARGGVVIQQEGGEVGGKKPKQKTTLYIDSGKIRIDGESPDLRKYGMIFDGDKQVLWMLSPDEGTYREMNGAQMEQMGQQMSQAMKQMEAQLANMPPEQRKMMEDMMKQRMGAAAPAQPTITVQEKGSGEKIGPYTTTHYEVLSNGQLSQEIWAASSDQVHLSESDFKTFQQLAKFYEPLKRNAPQGSWATPDMQQIKGLPVRTLVYEGGRASYEWNVLKVEQKSLESSLFTLPAGMKKQEMMAPGMGMGRGMGK